MSITKGQNNGQLYIGSVKWASDLHNVILFNSKNDRTTFLKQNLKLVSSTFDFANINTYVDIDSNIKNAETINYCMYIQDDEVSTTPYCCFVTDYTYLSPSTTRLTLQLDVFQQYIYDTTFYRSFVSRAIVSKSSDTVGAYTLPEPIGGGDLFSSEVSPFDNINWDIQWCLVAKSEEQDKAIPQSSKVIKTYNYGGSGDNETLTGVYCFYLNNATELKNILETYQSENAAQDFLSALSDQSILTGKTVDQILGLVYGMQAGMYQDHRGDLLSISAIPKWAKSTPEAVKSNNARIITQNTEEAISKTVLANGYVPRNKKMLTSLYNTLVIYNRNGFRQVLKPELLGNTVKISLSCCSQPEGVIRVHINDYDDIINSDFGIPYNAQTQFGYNGTTGNEWRNLTGGISGTISAIGGVATSLATANVAGLISNVASGSSLALSIADAIAPRGVLTGSTNGRLDIKKENIIPRLAKVCPNTNECVAIDDYFDKFGYSINKITDVRPYMTNRSNWNYIQTNGVHLSLAAPKKYADELRSLFDNGITIWHNYNNFGDYTKTNN